MNPKVTVVLTSCNHAPYIGESIESVLHQTYSNFELFIIDDASTDDSWAIIQRYTDPRIRSRQSKARGEITQHVFDVILNQATGKYVAVNHSDDAWRPEKLQRQVEYMEAHPETGAVLTWVQVFDEKGAFIDNDWFNRPNLDRWTLLNELFHQKNTLNQPSALVRRACYDTIGTYRRGLWQIDDADFWCRLMLHYPLHIIEEKLTLHRLFADRSNISGERPSTIVRRENEWNRLRENYLALSTFEDVVRIFPELESWRREGGCNVKFLLAMACVRSPHRSAWSLGLRWLFELLNDPVQSAAIADLYGFHDADFVALSAKLDSYGTLMERDLSQELQAMQAERTQLAAQLAAQQALLQSLRARANTEQTRAAEAHAQLAALQAQLRHSATWSMTEPLRRFGRRHPRIERTAVRAAKLAWWTLTLQLPSKLRARWHPAPQAPAALPHESVAAKSPPPIERLSAWLQTARRIRREGVPDGAVPGHLPAYFGDLGLPPEQAQAWAQLIEALRGGRDVAPDVLARAAAALDAGGRLHDLVAGLCAHPAFDAAFYWQQVGSEGSPEDAVRHYLLIGEPLGLPPSTSFDPVYYRLRHKDMGAIGINCLVHYVFHAGPNDPRVPAPPKPVRAAHAPAIDPGKENVILVVHETSRTGAPVLGWNIGRHLAQRYNVFSVLLRGGELTPAFEALSCETVGPFDGVLTDPTALELVLAPWLTQRRFRYAVVNSIESRPVLPCLTRAGVPTLLLVHEYGTYVWPAKSLRQALDTATEVVFPAASVARSSLEVHPVLAQRGFHVIAQGMSEVPAEERVEALATPEQPANPHLQDLQRRHEEGQFIVTGAGSVNLRKGVDVFIAVAADVKRLAAGRPIHFLWVGDGYKPADDMGYSVYLKEQLERAGVQADVTIMDGIPSLDPVYALTDVFLLASRLDPMPNVSIDAVCRGIPVVCFQEASGMADLLRADPDTAVGVVPYLDTHGAASVIARLASNPALYRHMAEATRRFGASTFDMARYVARLDALATAAKAPVA